MEVKAASGAGFSTRVKVGRVSSVKAEIEEVRPEA